MNIQSSLNGCATEIGEYCSDRTCRTIWSTHRWGFPLAFKERTYTCFFRDFYCIPFSHFTSLRYRSQKVEKHLFSGTKCENAPESMNYFKEGGPVAAFLPLSVLSMMQKRLVRFFQSLWNLIEVSSLHALPVVCFEMLNFQVSAIALNFHTSIPFLCGFYTDSVYKIKSVGHKNALRGRKVYSELHSVFVLEMFCAALPAEVYSLQYLD